MAFVRLLKALREFFLGRRDFAIPPALSARALVYYGLLTFLTLVALSPLTRTIPYRAFLAALSEELIVAKVNPSREGAAVAPLRTSPLLSEAARKKAEDMLTRDYFSHYGPGGEAPWVWLDRVGYPYAAAGENLAIDFVDPTTLVNAWMASPSHAANIRNGTFTEVGIGVASGTFQGRETNVVAMFLAKPLAVSLAVATQPEPPPAPVPAPIPPAPAPVPPPTSPPGPPQPSETPPAPSPAPLPDIVADPEPKVVSSDEPLVVLRTAPFSGTSVANAVSAAALYEPPNILRRQAMSFLFFGESEALRVATTVFLILVFLSALIAALVAPRYIFARGVRAAVLLGFLLALWLPSLWS